MNLEIVKQEKNQLLKVTDVRARLSFEGATPSKQQVVKALAAAVKAKEELIIVRHIRTDYGEQAADVRALVYADKKSLEKLERRSMIKKNTFVKKAEAAPAEPADAPKETKPEGEAPAEDKPADAPAEAPQEEPAKPEEAEAKPEGKKEPKAEEKAEKPQKETPKEKAAETPGKPKGDA